MKNKIQSYILIGQLVALSVLLAGCQISESEENTAMTSADSSIKNIIFLHHSTGRTIWEGGVPGWFEGYNQGRDTTFVLEERAFPSRRGYGWKNYPYDYWNIWVNHAGEEMYSAKGGLFDADGVKDFLLRARSIARGEPRGEPTLEILTDQYDLIIWKHCFPVSDVRENTGNPQIDSEAKRIENYKLQYHALREKMREFPHTRFIVWTGAARTEAATSREEAERAKQFFDWVVNEWDETGDNIYLWDFRQLETEGGLYLKDEYSRSATDSHPNGEFAQRVAPLFCQRIVDVVSGKGDEGNLTGAEPSVAEVDAAR